MYSLRLSLYRFDASTLAGDEVLGSLSKLYGIQVSTNQAAGLNCVGEYWSRYL